MSLIIMNKDTLSHYLELYKAFSENEESILSDEDLDQIIHPDYVNACISIGILLRDQHTLESLDSITEACEVCTSFEKLKGMLIFKGFWEDE